MNSDERKIGKYNINSYGSKFTIIDYISCTNITVQFENGYIVKNREYGDFKKGNIKSPYCKTVCGVGYLGEGKYNPHDQNNKPTQYYKVWKPMLTRCYDDKYKLKYPTYTDCTVCDEWHNFQVFALWYKDNYYEVGNEKMCLDKDILHKENKIYSPNNCIFVPERINILFTKSNATRGDYPIGVHYEKESNKFVARCSVNNKSTRLGRFKTIIEAFEKYKQVKEKIIISTANTYKNLIPKNLYIALINYKIEITD